VRGAAGPAAQIWSLGRIGRELAQLGRRWYSPERLAWGLIGLGALFRLAQYVANRSLWFDESALSLNIVNRSLAGLLRPLDYAQGAPVGFLILEKLIVQAGGDSEYVLRLIPLIAGLLALPLFYWVARHAIRPGAVPIALGLFAILDSLIYYSSEVKQYSSDVLVALIVFASAQDVLGRGGGLSGRRALVFGLIGGVALWFSHPAAFVLMGVGSVALVVAYSKRDWARIGGLAISALIWVLSLSILYYVSLRHLRANPSLLRYWAKAFLPFPPSLATVQWLGANTLFKVLEYPVGLVRPGIGIGALALLAGAIVLWTENRAMVLALLSPFVFTLAASALWLYPFADRLLLFGVPFIVLLIGEGAERIIAASKPHVPMIGVLLIGLLFVHPALSSVSHLIKPRTVQEARPVIAYLRTHEHNGDALYLYHGAVPAFRFYARRYEFARDSYVEGIDANRNRIAVDMNRFGGQRRAWMLFSHIDKGEQDFLLSYLDTRGTRLDSFQRDGAGVYLYDLSRNGHGSSY
jgi:hypothetical protein